MTAVFAIAGIVIVVAVGLLAVGRLGELPPPPIDRPPLDIPADDLLPGESISPSLLLPGDVEAVRFTVGLRGYRMDEVDRVLDRVADDLDRRDSRIRQLEDVLAASGVVIPPPGSSESGALAPLADSEEVDRGAS